MGGGTKGGSGQGVFSAYSSRRRTWNGHLVMAILLLGFGTAAIFGLVGLSSSLKHRRIFNHLIKDKDRQISSLNLQLQREKERAQEAKSESEDMKMKMYNLRAQKLELDGRISEMQSLISSLKDEQKTIELAFKEKQNEAMQALNQLLQQKEAEIEDLKRRLQLPAKVESVSTDEAEDPLILPESTTTSNANNTSGSQNPEKTKDMQESTTQEQSKNTADDLEKSMQSDDGQKEDGRENEQQQFEKTERHQETGAETERTNFDTRRENLEPKHNHEDDPHQNGSSFETGQEKWNHQHEHWSMANKEQKPSNEEDSEAHFTDQQEGATEQGVAQSRRSSSELQASDNYQELDVKKVGGTKLEIQENPIYDGSHTMRGKHRSYLKRSKGMRWRPIVGQAQGKENSGRKNGATTTISGQRLFQGTSEMSSKADEREPRNQVNQIQDKILEDKGEDNKTINAVDLSQKVERVDMLGQGEKALEATLTNSSSAKLNIPVDSAGKYETIKSKESETSGKGTVASAEAHDNEQHKEHDAIIRGQTEIGDDGKHDNNLARTNVAERNGDRDYIEVEDFGETDPENSNNSTDSAHSLEEDSDEDEAQTDQLEF